MTFTVHKDGMVPCSKDLPALLGYGLVPNLFALVEAA